SAAEPTEDERDAVDAVLGPPESGWVGGERSALDGHVARGGQAVRERRHLLLPALQALQQAAGWITEGGMGYVCRRLSVPPAEAYGVASFYALLSTEERPKLVLHVCDDVTCRVSGGLELLAELRGAFEPDRTDRGAPSPCLGSCSRPPAALLQASGRPGRIMQIAPAEMGVLRQFVDPGGWVLYEGGSMNTPQTRDLRRGDGLRLLRDVRDGLREPVDQLADPPPARAYALERYRDRGGYEGLRRAFEVGPSSGIAEVKGSKLLGRGRAALPADVTREAGRRGLPHRREAGGGGRPAGPTALLRLQRGRVRARDVQGSGPDGAHAVCGGRGAHGRGVRNRLRAGLCVHPRRVSGRRGAHRRRDPGGPSGWFARR